MTEQDLTLLVITAFLLGIISGFVLAYVFRRLISPNVTALFGNRYLRKRTSSQLRRRIRKP